MKKAFILIMCFMMVFLTIPSNLDNAYGLTVSSITWISIPDITIYEGEYMDSDTGYYDISALRYYVCSPDEIELEYNDGGVKLETFISMEVFTDKLSGTFDCDSWGILPDQSVDPWEDGDTLTFYIGDKDNPQVTDTFILNIEEQPVSVSGSFVLYEGISGDYSDVNPDYFIYDIEDAGRYLSPTFYINYDDGTTFEGDYEELKVKYPSVDYEALKREDWQANTTPWTTGRAYNVKFTFQKDIVDDYQITVPFVIKEFNIESFTLDNPIEVTEGTYLKTDGTYDIEKILLNSGEIFNFTLTDQNTLNMVYSDYLNNYGVVPTLTADQTTAWGVGTHTVNFNIKDAKGNDVVNTDFEIEVVENPIKDIKLSGDLDITEDSNQMYDGLLEKFVYDFDKALYLSELEILVTEKDGTEKTFADFNEFATEYNMFLSFASDQSTSWEVGAHKGTIELYNRSNVKLAGYEINVNIVQSEYKKIEMNGKIEIYEDADCMKMGEDSYYFINYSTNPKLKITYQDDTTEEVYLLDYILDGKVYLESENGSEFVQGIIGTTGKVKIYLDNKYTEADYEIIENPVDSIEIVTTEIKKDSYITEDGESYYDLTDLLELKINYKDGTSVTDNYNNIIRKYGLHQGYLSNKAEDAIFDTLEYDTSIIGNDIDITFHYAGKKATGTFRIAKEVEEIAIKSNPTKLTYTEGDTIDLTGGKITIKYNNDTSEDIDITKDMIQGFDSSKVGKEQITVTYKEKTCTFDVTIEAKKKDNTEETKKVEETPVNNEETNKAEETTITKLENIKSLSKEEIIEEIEELKQEDISKELEGNNRQEVLSLLKEIESKLDEVPLKVDDNFDVIDTEEIEVIGAALNGATGVVITKVEEDLSEIIPEEYDKENTYVFDITLEGVEDTSNLSIPVTITVPIPSDIDPDELIIIHYHEGEATIIKPEISSDKKYATFTVSGFSSFVMTSTAKTVISDVLDESTESVSSGNTLLYVGIALVVIIIGSALLTKLKKKN